MVPGQNQCYKVSTQYTRKKGRPQEKQHNKKIKERFAAQRQLSKKLKRLATEESPS